MDEYDCVNQYKASRTKSQYYKDNKESIKIKNAQCYKDNKESIKIKKAQYYKDNKVRILEKLQEKRGKYTNIKNI
jgi:hypothetical protein